jgi:hypothetical protein
MIWQIIKMSWQLRDVVRGCYYLIDRVDQIVVGTWGMKQDMVLRRASKVFHNRDLDSVKLAVNMAHYLWKANNG